MGFWIDQCIAMRRSEDEQYVPATERLVPIAGGDFVRAVKKLSLADGESIRCWLAHINEVSQAEIDSVLNQCREDSGALRYFLQRAAEVPVKSPPPLKRVKCLSCDHFKPLNHPHLGRCDKGCWEPMAGLWGAQSRYCEKFAKGDK
ncbi:MAG: hypothetical protein COB30_006740 [Ectothiorhodospiraceae bacterium]|nr:hypothetical protein [Ectothiorhodospiraceae bacterium]